MYGAKGTSTILNTVARQGVLTKQLVAPKSTAFLASLPTRQVSAGKLSYSTSRSTQFSQKSINQQQEQTELNNNTAANTLSHFPTQQPNAWTTVGSNGLKKSSTKFKSIEAATKTIEPDQINSRILDAAKGKNPKAVVAAFVQGKSVSGDGTPALSAQTYEAVIAAYNKLRKYNQPLTPLLSVYQDMLATGVQPSSQTYALLIRSLCNRDTEVQKTVSMLRRKIARTGAAVDNLGDLENEKNMEQALAIFNKAVQEKLTQAFDIELYNKLLYALSFTGNAKDGIFIYEHIESAHNTKPNGNTFATLMGLFGNAGDLNAVRECFQEYKLVRWHLPHHDPAYVYNALVYAHVNAGDITGAIDIVENLMVNDRVKVSILPYNKILRRACQEGNIKTVESILAKLESSVTLPKPNASTYGILLSAHCRSNDLEQASKAYQNLLQHDVSKQYGHIADYAYACTGNNLPDEAFKVVQDMTSRGLDLDSSLCQKVVMSYVENNRIDDAVAALQSVVAIYAKSNYFDQQSALSNMALDITLKCDDLNNVLSILQLMNNYSIHPPSAVCEAVLKMYEASKTNPEQWQKVSSQLSDRSFITLYDAVFRSPNTPDSFCETVFGLLKDMNSLNFTPSASLYVRVLTRMKKYNATDYESRWKEEFAPYLPTIQEQKKVEESAVTDASKRAHPAVMTAETDLISGTAVELCLDGKFEEALDILNNKIIKLGKVPTPEAVRDMIQSSTKAGRLDTAQEIFNTVTDSFKLLEGARKHRAYCILYNVMLIAHSRNGDLATAKTFYNQLRSLEVYPDGDAYGSLLSCSANSTTDESTDALAIYEEAKKHNVRPTVYFYNVIISKLAKCRKIELVLQLFDEMKQHNVAPNSITYASVISACIRCSSETRAARYFQEMISAPRYQPRIGAYNSMIQFYVQQRPNREKALEYYNLSKQFNLKPSQHTYKLLMEAYANIPAYDMLTAHKLLSEMNKRHNLLPTAAHYATLIRSYGCLHRDVQSALAVYKEMQKAGIKADETVYQAMLNTYIDNNDLKNAEELYKDMLNQGTKSSSYIENLFIAGYGAHGQLDKAETIFNKMSDEQGLIREPSTYEAMVKAYIQNGQKDKADTIVEQMRARDFPFKVVEGVAQLINASN